MTTYIVNFGPTLKLNMQHCHFTFLSTDTDVFVKVHVLKHLQLLLFTVGATDFCPDKGSAQGTAVISSRLKKSIKK